MVGLTQPLLASSDGIGELIGIVVVAVFWGIGALASVMKKAKQPPKLNAPPPLPIATATTPQRPQAERERMKIPNRRTSAGPLNAVAAKPPPPPAQRKVKRNKASQQSAKRSVPPAMPPPSVFAAELPPASPIAAGAIGVIDRPTGLAASTVDLRDLRTSMSPAAMRKQFIVAELLQPPLALRDQNL